VLLIIIIATTAITSYIGFNDRKIFNKYMFQVGAIQKYKEYFRMLSSGFLHADFMHLLFNMITLYFFSNLVIYFFGNFGFLLIYFGAIIAGNIFSLYIYQKNHLYSAIGASGGVSGILFAAIAINPHIGISFFFIPIPIPGYIFGALYFSYSVYMMLNPKQWDNLGHASHIGGAVLGLLYAFMSYPTLVRSNTAQILIMSLPLLYLGYRLVNARKSR